MVHVDPFNGLGRKAVVPDPSRLTYSVCMLARPQLLSLSSEFGPLTPEVTVPDRTLHRFRILNRLVLHTPIWSCGSQGHGLYTSLFAHLNVWAGWRGSAPEPTW